MKCVLTSFPDVISDLGYVGRLRWVAGEPRGGVVGDLGSLCLQGDGFPSAIVSGFTPADETATAHVN